MLEYVYIFSTSADSSPFSFCIRQAQALKGIVSKHTSCLSSWFLVRCCWSSSCMGVSSRFLSSGIDLAVILWQGWTLTCWFLLISARCHASTHKEMKSSFFPLFSISVDLSLSVLFSHSNASLFLTYMIWLPGLMDQIGLRTNWFWITYTSSWILLKSKFYH